MFEYAYNPHQDIKPREGKRFGGRTFILPENRKINHKYPKEFGLNIDMKGKPFDKLIIGLKNTSFREEPLK